MEKAAAIVTKAPQSLALTTVLGVITTAVEDKTHLAISAEGRVCISLPNWPSTKDMGIISSN
jgi:hypothetical protein